ncbi:MAG: sulfotransferase [Pseudomonadota bacterium]
MSAPAPRHGHIASYSYVFLLTYGRSGSTVLNRVMNAIPGYLLRGENQNALFELHRYLAALRSARFDFIRRDHGPEHPWFGANAIKVKRLEAECLTGFVRHALRPEADSTVLGFKEIRHTRWDMSDDAFQAYVGFLLEHFPGAKIVFNSRNWQDVARSGWWARTPPERVRDLIANADARFAQACATWPDRTLALRYESYAGQPEALRPLFGFLGASYDPGRVAPIMAKRLNHEKSLRRDIAPARPQAQAQDARAPGRAPATPKDAGF